MHGLEATYRIESTPDQIEARAQALAVEQSIEMPPTAVRQPELLHEVLAQVASIQEAGEGQYRVVCALPNRPPLSKRRACSTCFSATVLCKKMWSY